MTADAAAHTQATIAPFESDEAIAALAQAFLDRTLAKPAWTHAAHIAVAAWLIVEPGRDPENEMPRLIRAYNVATGTPNTDASGYHETITQASLRAVRHHVEHAPPGQVLHRSVAAILASPFGAPGWLEAYWSPEVLFSAEARRTWVRPDRAPLPF